MATPAGWTACRGVLVVVVPACLFASGCGSRDPLDTAVEAATPHAYLEWERRVLGRCEPELVREFRWSFDVLLRSTAGDAGMNWDDPHDTSHPVCRRIHGRTMRSVMVDALRTSNFQNHQQILADMESVRVLAAAPDEAGRDFSDRIASLQNKIRRQEEAVQRNDTRIRTLLEK